MPGLVGTILTMTMLIFTALSVTREIERGTMESLLSMPIKPVEVMFGKIVPYVLVGFIQASLVLRLDAINRGIKSRELDVVRHTRCPAVLVEGGFINNALEARLISIGEYRQRIASAVAEGIMSYQKTRPQPVAPPAKLAKEGT